MGTRLCLDKTFVLQLQLTVANDLDFTCDARNVDSTGIGPEQEPNKQQKTATNFTGSDLLPATPEDKKVAVRAYDDHGGWWASGYARQLFAPCNMVYNKECDVKADAALVAVVHPTRPELTVA